MAGGPALGDWPPDDTGLLEAWLKGLFAELEAHLGDGVIGDLAGRAIAGGRLARPERRRLMSLPLAIRLLVAMRP
ncbi:MAG TPA: hypothetical protein VMV92_04710, partial [Streptosporangiaceae bacterium]|nr:hypothetical protein [Streptosporangiaceae bacterium]